MKVKYPVSQISINPALWQLLGMYAYLLQRRAKAKGFKRRVSIARTMTGIIAYFLVAQRERILDEYKKARTEDLLTGLAVLDPDVARAISTVPDSGEPGDTGAGDAEAQERWDVSHPLGRESVDLVSRLSTEPGEVRSIELGDDSGVPDNWDDFLRRAKHG